MIKQGYAAAPGCSHDYRRPRRGGSQGDQMQSGASGISDSAHHRYLARSVDQSLRDRQSPPREPSMGAGQRRIYAEPPFRCLAMRG